MSEATREQLAIATRSERIVRRFYARIHLDVTASSCCWWLGACSGRGHGRFWIGNGAAVIAHRFAWALAYGVEDVSDAQMLAHWRCDNPLCVNVEHLQPSDAWDNSQQWSRRRILWTGPLADPRGARGRAVAIRDGLRRGRPLAELLAEGETALAKGQLALF